MPEGDQNSDFFQEAKKVDKKWVEGHRPRGEERTGRQLPSQVGPVGGLGGTTP